MSGSPDQHATGGPQEGEAGAAAPAAADAPEAPEELGLPRVSEELRPMSLTELFAGDPECGKPKQNPGQAGLARTHTFAGAGLDDELELKKLQVFVRIRPGVTAGAPRWDAENCIHATSKYSIAIAPPEGSQAYKSGDRGQTYSFTRVFDEHTAQTEYYEATAAPLVRDLLRNARHNSVMMAYGITAAGKTYTIEGTKDAPGVMPRALVDLFAGLAAHVEPLVARASYYEVYNEQIYDLLDEQGVGPLGHRAALRLKEDMLGRVFVAGLSEVEVCSADEALALLRRGSRQRQRGETALNYSSSRSHSIFTVTLYQQGLEGQDSEGSGSGEEAEEGGSSGEERLGRISFVDLAGSERAQRTGNVGVRLKESVAINSSLMTLGRCLEALRWNQQHKGGSNLRVVPYRESKVTHLFRDALHGWGQVILSVNVSPASKDYDETAHVLKYAALATQIGTIQAAEAPRRTIKAVSPAIKKVKRKAALPPEARGQGAKAKKPKKAAPAADKPADMDAAADPAEGAGGEAEQQQVDEQAVQQEAGEQHQQLQEASEEVSAQPSPHGNGAAAEDEPAAAEAADVAEYELGEGEWEGTPTTPLGDADDEATAALQAQVQQLIADLQRAEERCVLLEAEVREEVADEMAQLLRDMEESYRQRLEGEVAALELKMVAEGGRRGKRGGKAGKAEQHDAAEELATARDQAAHATAEAEQLRQQVAELQAAAERQQAEAAEHAAALQAAVDAAQQASTEVREQLAVEQRRAAELEAELAAARQAAAEAAASLGTVQQRAADLESELVAATEQAAAATAEAAAERQRAAELEGELVAVRAAVDSSQAAASQQYEAQLQEAVTQLEANKCMELEMSEEQAERLRKENVALQQRLGAALAALATYGSPSAGGPGGLVARMAQVAPEGNGRGAGGTPHDVALARARQAAAADELAAAAAAAGASTAGASTAPRSRSRFALEADAPMPGVAPSRPLDTVAEEGEEEPLGQPDAGEQQQQQQHAEEAEQPKPRRGRGRPKKAVAFAGLDDAATVDQAAPIAEVQQQQAAAASAPAEQQAAGESRQSRRMTRAGAALAAAPPPPPAAPAKQQCSQPEEAAAAAGEVAVEQPAKPNRRARRKTQAAALPPVEEAAEVEVQQPHAGPGEPQQGQEQQEEPDEPAAGQPTKPGRRGRRKTQAAALAPVPEGPAEQEAQQQDVPQPAAAPQATAEVEAHQVCAAAPAEAPAAAAAAQQPAAAEVKPRRRGRPAKAATQAEKENAPAEQPPAAQGSLAAALAAIRRSGGGAAAAQVAAKAVAAAGNQNVQQEKQQQQAAAADGGQAGKRKRRLLPSAPISIEMRAALGEVDGESVPLRQQMAARQAAAAAPADGGAKRSRRQTQFFRL